MKLSPELSATSERKEGLKYKFLINNFHGLFKSNKQVTNDLIQCKKEINRYSALDIRKEELRIYKDFVKQVLGYDVEESPDKDPFYKVSGVLIDKVYTDKASLILGKLPEGVFKIITSPTTVLLSGDYLLEEEFSLSVFDPLILNKERDWIIQFGFLTIKHDENKVADSRTTVDSGTVVFEPEVINAIRDSSYAGAIEKSLEEILAWFNHDLVSHGTFIPRNTLDQEIMRRGIDHADLVNIFSKDITSSQEKNRSHYRSAFAGELWSLNFHQSIFQQFVAERPAIVRYLKIHFERYITSVEHAVQEISDKKLAEDVKEYLVKAYAFGFFRLINPKDFATNDLFTSLRNKYPQMMDLGTAEDEVRKFTFGEEGLLDQGEGGDKFIPHKEVFQKFTQSFDKAKDFVKIERKLKLIGEDPNALSPEEKKVMALYLGKMDKYALLSYIGNYVDTIDGDDNNIWNISSGHRQEIIDVFLEGEFKKSLTFIQKVYKRIYGFHYKQMMQNHLSQDRRRKYYSEE